LRLLRTFLKAGDETFMRKYAWRVCQEAKDSPLLAAASRVQEAFPGVEVRAFALLRTLGLIPAVQRLLNPCKGQIRWRGGDAHRYP
jgi:hypothetical protein